MKISPDYYQMRNGQVVKVTSADEEFVHFEFKGKKHKENTEYFKEMVKRRLLSPLERPKKREKWKTGI